MITPPEVHDWLSDPAVERDDRGWEKFRIATSFGVYCKYGSRIRRTLHAIPQGAFAWAPPGHGSLVGGYTLCEECYAEMRAAEVEARQRLGITPDA